LIATVESPRGRLLEDEKNKYCEHACSKVLDQTRTNVLATAILTAQALLLRASSFSWLKEKVYIFLDLKKKTVFKGQMRVIEKRHTRR
jgi:hypothetical protein